MSVPFLSRVVASLFAAVAVLLAALVVVAVPINLHAETDSGLVELASLAVGSAILRWAVLNPGLIRLALIAETADMLTFVLAWQRGAAELNPIAGAIVHWAGAVAAGAGSFSFAIAGIGLVAAKLALVAFLVAVAPKLGPYRRAVLWVAAVAGLIGAVSNVVALVPA
jgi:hypothetical protein